MTLERADLVARLVCAGMSQKEIAIACGISQSRAHQLKNIGMRRLLATVARLHAGNPLTAEHRERLRGVTLNYDATGFLCPSVEPEAQAGLIEEVRGKGVLRLNPQTKECDHCGATFTVGVDGARSSRARFCSENCHYTFHNEARRRAAVAADRGAE